MSVIEESLGIFPRLLNLSWKKSCYNMVLDTYGHIEGEIAGGGRKR
ncbi:hypothetical protein J2Z83_001924 [Virgibacillus natechei]|uniref:Uncharacterized protein n=1 Tax=Virgibacillus natechei TaxID=1216297 RepID=A0ABS4IHM0_9BACI|nr:hypothetical protein [Virgibacillus natechei]